METKEIFLDIIGYEGLYQVSNKGRVRSLARLRMIALTLNGKGKHKYLIVHLWKNNTRTKFYLHRLLATHFLKGPKRDTVNHNDGNKLNNSLDNLEWATYSENNQHAHDTGLMNPSHGVARPEAKLTDDKVRHIRRLLASGMSQRKVAEFMGVSRGPIQRIAEAKGWKHVN